MAAAAFGSAGGAGGAGVVEFRHDHDADQQRDDSAAANGGCASGVGGAGGAGVSNAGTITRLSNSGAIVGGHGGNGFFGAGAGGAGVSNAGTIRIARQ